MAFNEPPFRQADSDQIAPDVLIFINGDDKLVDTDGNTFDIRNDITSVNTSLDVESVPGTAGFTITLPDHIVQRFTAERTFKETKRKFIFRNLKLMSEVEIYFKGRFPKERDDGSLEYPYYPSFWGIITNIVENYNDGVNTIQVSCADILRWWQITNVTINPSAVANNDEYLNSIGLANSDKLDYLNGKTVINDQGERVSIYGNIYAGKNIPEIILSLARISLKDMTPFRNALDAQFGTTDKIGAELTREAVEDIINYWAKRFEKIGRNLRIFGFEQNDDGTLEIVENDFLKTMPFPLEAGAPPTLDSSIRSKLDIANEVKDFVNHEFFLDVNGEIIFKPPFYNMNVITNRNSVIRDLDIIGTAFNQSEAEVITRVDVTGTWTEAYNNGREVIKGIVIDQNLAKQFGLRVHLRDVRHLHTKEQCFNYAAGELCRLNALARQGTISIMGRPELRLGYPIYIPSQDAFYYVKGISHSFTFGGTFTTDLTLVAERRRKIDANGNPIENEIFRSVGEVTNATITEQGKSLIDEIENETNFISRLKDVCVPSKRKEFEAVEANFIDQYESLESTKQGDWKSLKGISLGDTFDPKIEYKVTDGEGFELIPFFNHGLGLKFTDDSTINERPETILQDETRTAAEKATNLTPQETRLTVNPNNVALTLNDSDSSMLNLFDNRSITKASKAQSLDPTK